MRSVCVYRPDKGVIGQKNFFLRFHFPIAHWKGHVLQKKVYENITPLLFVFQSD